MTNGNPRISHLVQSALKSNGVLDDKNEIQFATQFTAQFESFRAHILVYNTGKIVVQGRWSPLKAWLGKVKRSIETGKPIPAFEPPID
ncbi:MAG: hypothetical protein RLZZ326_157 [Planctomycetota bacterium]|jgi:ribonuclease HIII